MRVLALFVVVCTFAVHAIDNGIGLTPPMGWRSWNCYGGDVDDAKMRATMSAMAERSRSVDGQPTSIADLGYNNCGLDDNWQACGTGIDGSFHDSAGAPLINTKTFPDMKGMTDFGHKLGLKVGWYHNNCICRENQFKDTSYIETHYEGDVKAIVDLGFDSVKLDGCGEFLNMTLWANLLNATGRPVMIENCHWGQCTDNDDSSCPTEDWCPMNFFRSSPDIKSIWLSMFANLQSTRKWQDVNKPLSRPGCWAYPDMLEVGRMMGGWVEDRSHFGAWCIVSAPLVLGLDLTDSENVDRVWDIFANKEAIAVNQAWAGHPGRAVKSMIPGFSHYASAEKCDTASSSSAKWSYNQQTKQVMWMEGPTTLCLDASYPQVVALSPCNNGTAQQFIQDNNGTLAHAGQCLDVYDWTGPVVQVYPCNGGTNQVFTFGSDGSLKSDAMDPTKTKCLQMSTVSPGDTENAIQLWTKPVDTKAGAVAVFAISNSAITGSISFSLTEVGIPSTVSQVSVRDVWHHLDLPNATTSSDYTTDSIESHDSRFYIFTPIH